MPPLVLDGTNGVSGVDGTASNPSYEGTDSNTGIFYPAADTWAVATGGTERLRVDSAGNAGLATTSISTAVWGSTYPKLAIGTTTNAGVLQFESTAAAANNKYLGGMSALNLGSGVTANESADILFYQDGTSATNPGGRISFFTRTDAGSVTEKMRLDASGNLGIGETSPTAPLHIKSATNNIMRLQSSDNVTGNIYFSFYNSSGTQKGYIGYGASADDSLQFYNVANSYMNFATNDTERARITSGGDFLIGTTTKLTGGVDGLDINTTADTGITFAQNGTVKNWFYLNGSTWQWQTVSGVAVNVVSNTNGVTLANGGTSWGSLSDERLKDILEPIDNAVSKVSSLRTVIGKYKTEEEGIRRSMLIAQDVREVLPEAVIENNDGNLILQYTDTIPLLVAAIKELNAKVEAQAAEIAALKGTA